MGYPRIQYQDPPYKPFGPGFVEKQVVSLRSSLCEFSIKGVAGGCPIEKQGFSGGFRKSVDFRYPIRGRSPIKSRSERREAGNPKRSGVFFKAQDPLSFYISKEPANYGLQISLL